MMRVVELDGGHHQMGWQYARQVRELRPRIKGVMRRRMRRLKAYEADLRPTVAELTSAWEEIARPTLDMLRGVAEGLELEWEPFFRYTIAPYLADRIRQPAYGEGCTVWAASGSITRQGMPILAKNRDYRPEHQSLPCLARVQPARGYRHMYATSAGSPAVFSSGMNETGLAVADTRVTSCIVGPGLARYSAMMEILEHHSHVSSALDYLSQVPHLGEGTLTLVDRAGDMAVFEAGHAAQSILFPENDSVVSTNHFRSPQLRECWVDRYSPELRGSSQNRYARVDTALQAAHGRVDGAWAQTLMADHGGPQPTAAERSRHAICRHSEFDTRSITISTTLFLPRERTLLFANGQPCQAPFQTWSVI
jgi:isopenicillin-N N-acyltransferase-like protein